MNTYYGLKRRSAQVPSSCSLSSSWSFGDLATTQSSGTIPILLFGATEEDPYVHEGNSTEYFNTDIDNCLHMTPSISSSARTCGTLAQSADSTVKLGDASPNMLCLEVANAVHPFVLTADGSNGVLSESVYFGAGSIPGFYDILLPPEFSAHVRISLLSLGRDPPEHESTLNLASVCPAITTSLTLMKRNCFETFPTDHDHFSVQFKRASSSIRKPDASSMAEECALVNKAILGGRSCRSTPITPPSISIPTAAHKSAQSCSVFLTEPFRPAKHHHRTMSSAPLSSINLPDHLSWLQNTFIDLWIDQEGFRAVYPTFKFVGYTKPELSSQPIRAGMHRVLGTTGGATNLTELMDRASADPDCRHHLDVGMAEFMPMKRKSFVFHHGTFDVAPLIRRLSINGDDTKDFLSQHAHLNLKSSNGVQVYTVHGTETKRSKHDDDGRPNSLVKLEWRFEYTVEDKRKHDGTKVGGEKILTPLQFSCSPGIVHPEQGRKVTVMQVWRKNLQPRAVAGKVAPPKPPDALHSGPPSSLQDLAPKTIGGNHKFSGGYKMAIWNINGHRRPKTSYGILKETDEEVGGGRPGANALARRNSISSIDDFADYPMRQSLASMRSRSLDARFADVDPGIAHMVQMSREELDQPQPGESDEEGNLVGHGLIRGGHNPLPFHRRAQRLR